MTPAHVASALRATRLSEVRVERNRMVTCTLAGLLTAWGGLLTRRGVLIDGDINALFIDGSIRLLSRKADEIMLRAAIGRDGGRQMTSARRRGILHRDAQVGRP